LCYSKKYRGSIGVRNEGEWERLHQKPERAFEIPEINVRALDPFDLDL